jgi:hypothetical protein
MLAVLAILLASQIHTGADLVAACEQPDKSACIAFFRDLTQGTARDNPDWGLRYCLQGHTDADIAAAVIREHQIDNKKLQASGAAEIAIYSHLCNQ